MTSVREESRRPVDAPVPRTLYSYSSRPEVDMLTASQLTGAKQAAEYSWRVSF
jgi:hypothetical protein